MQPTLSLGPGPTCEVSALHTQHTVTQLGALWTRGGSKPANVVGGGRESPAGGVSRRAFTPAVILFIALSQKEDNSEPG